MSKVVYNKASHGDVFSAAASPSLQSRACWRRYKAREWFGICVQYFLSVH